MAVGASPRTPSWTPLGELTAHPRSLATWTGEGLPAPPQEPHPGSAIRASSFGPRLAPATLISFRRHCPIYLSLFHRLPSLLFPLHLHLSLPFQLFLQLFLFLHLLFLPTTRRHIHTHNYYLRRCLASKDIVMLGITLCVCPTALVSAAKVMHCISSLTR